MMENLAGARELGTRGESDRMPGALLAPLQIWRSVSYPALPISGRRQDSGKVVFYDFPILKTKLNVY